MSYLEGKLQGHYFKIPIYDKHTLDMARDILALWEFELLEKEKESEKS